MRFVLFACLTVSVALSRVSCQYSEEYNEDLTLSDLPDGKLLAHFEFTTKVAAQTKPNGQIFDYRLYPKAIGEILQSYNVHEMHLSFTQGRWNYDEWGYPPTLSSGTGVELWAWMKDSTNVDTHWKSLTNSLSGLFCASLNFIDETITTEPRLSFRTDDVETKERQLRYGYLPHENVCTENLTPWIKLLPCKSKSGISVLLNPHRIYNSNFHSMAVHAKSVCSDEACTQHILELKQTVTSVMDPVRTTSRRDWSLEAVFERQLRNACPLATQSRVLVDLKNVGDDYELKPYTKEEEENNVAVYHLPKGQSVEPMDIRMTFKEDSFQYPLAPAHPMIYADRYFTGLGQERGGLKITIHNRNKESASPVIYYDSVPWYLKVYLHTLKVDVYGSNATQQDVIQDMYYQPAIDRGRPTTLELKLIIPAGAVVTLSMDFDKVFLKYTEHRPDANRGFDVGPAVLTTWIPESANGLILSGEPKRIYTDTLLVSLPTPDFSMPYNVITLTCTVIALFFGSVFNLLIRNFTVVEE